MSNEKQGVVIKDEIQRGIRKEKTLRLILRDNEILGVNMSHSTRE